MIRESYQQKFRKIKTSSDPTTKHYAKKKLENLDDMDYYSRLILCTKVKSISGNLSKQPYISCGNKKISLNTPQILGPSIG